ncbi:MAG TPA: radical SAM protein [Spirochaetota bacterium]|nr:radical SAM protein [Spirochaetota bacterium]
MKTAADTLRLVFWELTKRCNLRCAHCRAEADDSLFSGELDTASALGVVDEIAAFASPILVLTGGEPLYRADLFEIARYAGAKGLRTALATNGTLIDGRVARAIREAGFGRASISIDGSSAASHDGFRGIPGSFDLALAGARLLREEGVEFQLNTTITRRNVDEIEDVLRLTEERGAKALHVFMLVPVGCGVEIAESDMLSREKYEEVLVWLYHRTKDAPFEFKATCAPHYYRIMRQEAKKEGRTISFEIDGMAAMTRGCLAGGGVCFISHRGDVQPCGYLPLVAGNVRDKQLGGIWRESDLFGKLRKIDDLGGKCGLCEYRAFCAGCRARAYYETGDCMAEEPYCVYEPKRAKAKT